MNPISWIVAALATGAAAGLKSTTENLVKDAYEGLKDFIKRKYSNKVNPELLDQDPASKSRQEIVKTNLSVVAAGEDVELLNRVKEFVELIRKHAPDVPGTVGFKLEDLTAESIIIAGRDINITQQYMVARGIIPYEDFLDGVLAPEAVAGPGTIAVEELRRKLLRIGRFPKPELVTVRGTLFPCALLTAGWWDRRVSKAAAQLEWHDNIQKWLFHGFDLWGPSWDFTWDVEQTDSPYVIAQLGSGDEADSIPVLIPREKASRLQEYFQERWGGGDVEVTALLGHRSQFSGVHKDVELVGGLLDYCLWIDDNNKNHRVLEVQSQTEVYSGYLWKCVTPRSWYEKNKILSLNQVYFIWEHTNFRDQDAIRYNLDSLAHKEEYLAKLYGEMVLLQRSSPLVPGKPLWTTKRFYEVFVRKEKKIII